MDYYINIEAHFPSFGGGRRDASHSKQRGIGQPIKEHES